MISGIVCDPPGFRNKELGLYSIYLKDGLFYCNGRVQDGTERWTETTLKDAVKSMKEFAWISNHTKIKKKDITFYRPRQVVETVWEECNPQEL